MAATNLFLYLILIRWIVCWRERSHLGFSLISQTVTFLKGDGVGKAQGMGRWGWGCMFSDFLLPPLSPSPDSVYIFAADRPLIKDHTPSAGESTREKGGRGDWIGGVEDETVSVCSHLNQFRIHSITSYCDSHFGVFGRCKGCESETAGGNGQHFAVGCFSPSVCL